MNFMQNEKVASQNFFKYISYFIATLTILPNSGRFHLQRTRLAHRGRKLLQIPGSVSFEACICSNVETSLS